MMLNKKISQPNFIIYCAEDMPNKYVKKYYGVIPVLTCAIKSVQEEQRLNDFADNFILIVIYHKFMLKKKNNSKIKNPQILWIFF